MVNTQNTLNFMSNKLLAFLLCLPFDFQFLQGLENKAPGGIAIHAHF